jgi:hypothetical protein
MKKINTSNVIEGVRKLGLVKASIEHLQESYSDIFNELIYSLVITPNPVALYGLTNSSSHPNYNISSGAIFLNGEVYNVDAFSGTAPGGQVPRLLLSTTYRSGDPVKYSDGNNFNTHEIRKLVWVFGTAGTGLCDFSALLLLRNRINNNLLDVPGQIAAIVDAAPGALDTLNELAAALADDPNFATTMTNALAGKVAKAGDTMSGNLTIPNGSSAGHAVNKSQLDSEATARSNADTTLQNNINTEASTRSNEDALKVTKSGDTMSGVLTNTAGFRTDAGQPALMKKVIQIGDWNMDTTSSKPVAHGLGSNYKKIRGITVIVRDDADGLYHSLINTTPSGGESGLVSGTIDNIDSTNITLRRLSSTLSGWFDSTAYDSTSYNRGWVTIEYEA